MGGRLSCWRTRTLGRLILTGGAGGERLVITPTLLPPVTFFVCALVLLFVVAGAAVATAALDVAVAAADVESAACVAAVTSTSAVEAVVEMAAAASRVAVAAAGAQPPGLGRCLHVSAQANVLCLSRSLLCALASHLPRPLPRGLLPGRCTHGGVCPSGMEVDS